MTNKTDYISCLFATVVGRWSCKDRWKLNSINLNYYFLELHRKLTFLQIFELCRTRALTYRFLCTDASDRYKDQYKEHSKLHHQTPDFLLLPIEHVRRSHIGYQLRGGHAATSLKRSRYATTILWSVVSFTRGRVSLPRGPLAANSKRGEERIPDTMITWFGTCAKRT